MSEALPGPLPSGERVLWEGRPAWRTLARRAFHLRKLSVYFAVLLVWYVATAFAARTTPADAAIASLRMAALALTPLGLICLYAWVTSRMTIYTITNRRVVLRIGVAMPITLNLPFARVDAANLKAWPNGHGDLVLTLRPAEHVAYMMLWPHAKPCRMARPEPALRAIPDAAAVGQILGRALAASANMAVVVPPETASNAGRASAAALA